MSVGDMEQRMEGIRKHANELFEQAYHKGFKEGVESCARDVGQACKDSKNDGITEGRNETWEAARKLVSMGYKKCNEVLSDDILTIETNDEIFTRCTASEAIEKLRAYEEKKKQEEDSEIHVGDEVVWTEDNSELGVVTRIESSENAMWIVKPDGLQICASKSRYWKKTGRTFPQIAEVLKKMQEDKE